MGLSEFRGYPFWDRGTGVRRGCDGVEVFGAGARGWGDGEVTKRGGWGVGKGGSFAGRRGVLGASWPGSLQWVGGWRVHSGCMQRVSGVVRRLVLRARGLCGGRLQGLRGSGEESRT
jgi:hypothetical protein